MKTYKRMQLRIEDDGTINAPGEIVHVEYSSQNNVLAIVATDEVHRLAFAEPSKQSAPLPDEATQFEEINKGGSAKKADDEDPEDPESELELESMDYRDLQSLAVLHGVKGNLPRAEMIEQLREAVDNVDE
jgi:hypothetical protein